VKVVRHLAIGVADESKAVGCALDEAMPGQVVEVVEKDVPLRLPRAVTW
jgi:hypothetical protein